MGIRIKDFRVRPGEPMRLKDRPTWVPPFYASKQHYQELLRGNLEKLSALQDLLYASDRYALLLLFQGMDTSGKDGVIKHVMSGVNPQGCQVHSFKEPAGEELEHDFLWRCVRRLPGRRRIGIFNRSYYEEVLIVRVHPELLRREGIPKADRSNGTFWRERFRSIVDLERHLQLSSTRIVKFFLHVSKEEQRRRLLARLADPRKQWKASLKEVNERKRWKQYQRVYADCLTATSTSQAPWYVVPADDKRNARLIVSQAIIERLEQLRLRYPKVSEERRRELEESRRRLENER
jgi:PPK2 family polyphosphate:nucleotide phosphotransferase